MAGEATEVLEYPWSGTRSNALDLGVTRLLDIAVSLCAIVLIAPLLVLIAAAIALFDRGPIIFAQPRVGRNGRMFACFKFRSMVVDADLRLAEYLAESPEAQAEWDRDHKLRNDPRITKLGLFLRKSSLDELPQLFNVLRGDMALVGPRPIVTGEIVRYGRYFTDYCAVKPGITGLWQVSGRNDVSYRRRVALDTCYARSRSLGLDLKIAAKTVPAVLRASGCY